MSDSESQDKQLEEVKDRKAFAGRVKQAAAIVGVDATDLGGLTDEVGHCGISERAERILKTVKRIEALDDSMRMEFWTALYPHLVPHLERAWADMPGETYERSLTATPFRAPHHAETVTDSRTRFLWTVCDDLRDLNPDAVWIATWSHQIGRIWERPAIGQLLAAVLRGGGSEADGVRAVVLAAMNGEHETSVWGRNSLVALLNSNHRADWEAVGRLLIAAQRQEGVRQAVLENLHTAHPDAFRFLLALILEHNLARFSATVRAVDMWLDLRWAGGSVKVINDGLRLLRRCLDDPSQRDGLIATGEAEAAYTALWGLATEDAGKAVATASILLDDPDPGRRYAALRILDRTGLQPETRDAVAARLNTDREEDPRLLMAMCTLLAQCEFTSIPDGLFERLSRLFDSLPRAKKKLEPIVWPWAQIEQDRRVVADALSSLAVATPEAMIPYAQALDSWNCVKLVTRLTGIAIEVYGMKIGKRTKRPITPEVRGLLLNLMVDPRNDVQAVAFQAAARLRVEDDEIELLLSNLHRSAATLRAGAIRRLLKLPDVRVISCATGLIESKTARKVAAGLELLESLVAAHRSAERARKVVAERRNMLDAPRFREMTARIIGSKVETATLEDSLGLVPPASRAKPITPRKQSARIETGAAENCLKDLARLFLKHGETEITVKGGEISEVGESRVLMAAAGWRFPAPMRGPDPPTREYALEKLPLVEVWLDWLENRGPSNRDQDGLELVRAAALFACEHRIHQSLPRPLRGSDSWNARHGFERLLQWLVGFSKPVGGGALLVQLAESTLAANPRPGNSRARARRWDESPSNMTTVAGTLHLCREMKTECPYLFTAEDLARFGALAMIAMDARHPGCDHMPSVSECVAAIRQGYLNDRDFVWLLLHPPMEEDSGRFGWRFSKVSEVCGRREPDALKGEKELIVASAQVRDRLLELELKRGEQPTAATGPASQLRYAGGASMFMRLAAALGSDAIVRQHEWFGSPTRAGSLSRLLAITFPSGGDTTERFAALFLESGLSERRLIELAMFAPQWAALAQHTLGQEGLEDVIWWIHTHTRRTDYWRDQELKEAWEVNVNERTSLSAEDLQDGAVDVAWFRRIIDRIGEDRWVYLQKPAKYATNSGGHKRAQLFADAMLGRVDTNTLVQRIQTKRHQDAVRALGLVPLPASARKTGEETLARYNLLQEFRRSCRKFGSQRQASEARAVEIGMQNLARTAGYHDPQRLQWAMETRSVADLAKGPVIVAVDDTTVRLRIDELGQPELTVTRNDKALKAIPARHRKDRAIAELKSRMTDLRRQRSRMRLSLEQSMCRGDEFTSDQLAEFTGHPMLRSMVSRLIFVGRGDLIGYPNEAGRVLRDFEGRTEPVGNKDTLRIAHPIDLLERGDWSQWQRECFTAERMQPFKQIFREVYPLTTAERSGCDLTRRYGGHQVSPRQALALLKQRQWVHTPYEGVRRVYHDAQIVAQLWFDQVIFTPAEVEDLTLAGVSFMRRDQTQTSLLIDEVPARLFSEAMRDLDLVVSAAHAGGVDPEASASTVEMRAALLAETARLLGLSNVRIDGSHVLIDGSRGRYSVHLGSANAQLLPSMALCIVAVPSQYRGRLFLPFADDDPKTAEVMSKTILLARDSEIRDPVILEQICGQDN